MKCPSILGRNDREYSPIKNKIKIKESKENDANAKHDAGITPTTNSLLFGIMVVGV